MTTKAKNKLTLPAPTTGGTTKAEIEKLLTDSNAGSREAVTQLRWQDIKAAKPGVFQWRDAECDRYDKARHVSTLMRALSITGKPLDPLLVFPAGSKFFLIEGHHRHAAYRYADWKDPVPVEVFSGSLDEACMAALRGNNKDKLPMTRIEKSNAAWRLVLEDKLSKNEIKELGLVGRTTVGDMRHTRDKIQAAGKDPFSMDWEEARCWTPHDTLDTEDPDWRETKVQELVEHLHESGIATQLLKHPDLMMLAFGRIDKELPCELAYQIDPDILDEVHKMRQADGEIPFDPNNIDVEDMADF
jgi:hypothetical protein